MNFKELGLSEQTIKAIDEMGIYKPTTVQKDVIPSVLEGKDIFTIAPAGCGKTCSYVFPLIDIISRRQGQNILIITADSAQSVAVSDRLAVFNKYHEINEETLKESQQDINQEANVIIASPDLLLDIAAEKKIDLSGINILVVDDINLIKKKRQLTNLEKILEMLPTDKQNIVFTNRRSKETQGILDKILKAPAEIKIDRAKEDEAAVRAAEDVEVSSSGDAPKASDVSHGDSRNTRHNNRNRRGKGMNQRNATPPNPQTPENQNLTEVETAPMTKPDGSNLSVNAKAEKTSINQDHLPQRDAEAVELMNTCKTFGDKTPEFLLVKGELVRNEG